MTKKKTILMNAFNVIKQMPDKDLKKYGIEMTPYDGCTDHDLLVNLTKKVDSDHEMIKSDHEILMNLVKKVDSDHEILMALVKQVQADHQILIALVKEVKQLRIDFNNRIDNLVAKNNLIE